MTDLTKRLRAVGIAATAGLRIFNNQIVANTTAGILASGVGNVEIAGNTMLNGETIRLDGAQRMTAR